MVATSVSFSSSYTVSGGAALVSVTAYMNLSPSGSSSTGTYPTSWWGTWGSGSGNYYRSFTGSVQIVTWSGWISLAYGSTTTVGFGASGTNYWGTGSGEHYITLPAIPYAVPRPPKSPAASRVSDTQANTSWTVDYDSSAGAQPWTGVYIDRWSKSSGTWTRVASVSWNVNSWTDKGITANNQYKYRYASYNSAGTSQWAETALFATTPSAPTGVTAEKTGGNIDVTWTNTAVHQDGTTIFDNDVQVGTVGPGVSSFTHISPSTAVTHQYTVKATTTTPALTSATSTPSNVVQLLAPPNAPTGVAFDRAVYDYVGTPQFVLSWHHNPVDSSTQTKHQVRYKLPGDVSWTELAAVSSTAQSWSQTFDYLDDEMLGQYQMQVRTWGAYVDPSPYSATATALVENRPAVTIISPAPSEVITTSQVTLDWTYAQAQGRAQQSYETWVVSDGVEVYRTVLASALTAVTYPIAFLDGKTYSLSLKVTAANGLVSDTITTTLSVDYAEPAVPLLECSFDQTRGANLLSIYNDDLPIETVSNRVFRNVKQDSEWYGIPANTTPPAPITNVYTDPSFEVGTDTEVARNLFTNPNLVGDGTWAEVARFATGSTPPAMAQPEDFRVRDLGAGESVMEIERVRGLTTLNSIAGVSTRDGKPAARLIPLGTSSETYAYFSIPSGSARALGVGIGTLHLDSAISGEVNTSAVLTIDATEPRQPSDKPANVAGSYPLRASYSSLTSLNRIRIWHGGTQGSGDVWWTDIGLFAGVYDGEAFSGDESPDPDLVASWAGTPDNSESILTSKTFPQITGGIQTDSWAASGTKSLRVDDSATLTVANPSSVVAVAKDAGQTLLGTTSATSTEPGETLRVEATGQAVMLAGYWDDLTVVEVEGYVGPTFDGSSGSGKTPETFLYDTIWDGAVNASTSTRTFLYPAFLQDDWEFVGEVPANTTLSDFEGLTYGRTMYLVEAVSAIPSVAKSFIVVDATSKYAWLGYGEQYANTIAIPYNVTTSDIIDLADVSLHDFDGRELPVVITGKGRSHKITVNGSVDPLGLVGTSWEELLVAGGSPGVKVYRDHDGRRVYASISAVKSKRVTRELRDIAFSVTEVSNE